MHRRQYLPGSHVKLNRSTVNEQNRKLRERLASRETEISLQREALDGWRREAIVRGFLALIAAIKAFFMAPFRRFAS